MSVSDAASVLRIAAALLLWPSTSPVGKFVTHGKAARLIAQALDLPDIYDACPCQDCPCCCRPIIQTGTDCQSKEAVMLAAVSLLTTLCAAVLRADHFRICRVAKADVAVVIDDLLCLVLKSFSKHKNHQLSGVLMMLSALLSRHVNCKCLHDILPEQELTAAVQAGTCFTVCLQVPTIISVCS